MKLEDELKQSKFQSEHQKAMLNILFTSNWLSSESAQILKPFDISSQQYNVLRILKGQGDKAISVNDIMTRMLDRMSNASRLVEKLRKKELIERVTCERDRRQVDVKITKKGLKLLEKADLKMNSFGKIETRITKDEAILISEILEKVRS